MATKDNVQGVVLALFGASAGGHLAGLTAAATANGLTAVAGDLAASAGFILGKDLSTAAAFRDNMLTGLGISSTNSAYAAAAAWADGELAKAGANRGEIVATAVNFLAGLTDSTSPFFAAASAYRTTVTAAVAWSEGAGATVFGVAALQAQQGTSSNVEGSTFTLTTSDDTPVMTAGSDTVNATALTLSNDDRVFDPSTTDADVLNIVATRALPTAMDVTNVEAINIDWQGFAKPDVDLTEVTGATVTLTSTKSGYMGHADFDGVGSNKVVAGAGIVGDVTVDDAEDTTITATAARSLTLTTSDGDLTVTANVATEIDIAAGDTLVLNAPAADDVVANGGTVDSATFNLGVDGTLDFVGATDAVVAINSDADIDLELVAGFVAEELTLGGDGAITLTFADDADADGLILNNGGEVRIASAQAAGDLSDIDAATASFDLGAGDNELTLGTDLAAAEISVTAGAGDDTVELDGDNTDTAEITIDLGAGTDRLVLTASANTTDYTLSLSGVEEIEVTTAAVMDASQLTGKSYHLLTTGAAGVAAIRVEVDMDAAGSVNFADLTIDNTLDGAILGLNIDGHTGNDTIVGSDGCDDIDTGTGTNTVTGGLGGDIMTSAGTDTFIINAADTGNALAVDGPTNTIDRIVSFATGTDKIKMAVAATAANYTEVDGAGLTTYALALAAARTALDGTVKYVYVYSVDDTGGTLDYAIDGIEKAEGILVYDADGVDGGEDVIVLAGTADAAFLAYTDITAI